MAPIPLEGDRIPSNNLAQEGNRGGSMSLGLLIDFIVQRTYHEMTVLAELLPRKTDMERKIEIYNFAARTRQLFIRLLALVKWANSATKVEKSGHIMAFLDKQSLLFIDTADIIARMARETLVHARLPNFHLPAAVEVLTTGTYDKLPRCIREKIVPPDPISIVEERDILQKLNQVIQHRLVTRNLLPQMKSLVIDLGRVTFRVEREFSVSLTVMGDGFDVPWRLLDLEILVNDRETGDGRSLIHDLQANYILQIVQARLLESYDPLVEIYRVLHTFCQSLQLEVLYSQALRLMRDRLDDFIWVDRYIPGQCLSLSYWKELSNKDSGSELGYRLNIMVDEYFPAKPLVITHTPSLSNMDCDSSDLTSKFNQLSMEYLLVHAIYVRTRNRLADLKQELQCLFKGIECTLAGSPAILSVPILQPCLRAELLLIAVDTHSGMFQCHIPQYTAPIIREIDLALNEDRCRLPLLVSKLRYWITRKRCQKTLQHLPATPYEKLPLLYPPEQSISTEKVFVKFHKHPSIVLVVLFDENPLLSCEIQYSFRLWAVKPHSTEWDNNDGGIDNKITSTLKFDSSIEFDSFVMTHGSFTNIDCDNNDLEINAVPDSLEKFSKKRRTGISFRDSSITSQNKKSRSPAYFIPELAHAVALCDEQIPFVMLARELTGRGITHQGLQIEANATALVLKLVHLPSSAANTIPIKARNALLKRLLSVSIRIQGKGLGKMWLVEFVFYGSPLISSHPKEQGLRRLIHFQYEIGTIDTIPHMVDSFLDDWEKIVKLYELVHDFSESYELEKNSIRNLVSIKSYNYCKIMILYGPCRRATVSVQWDPKRKAFQLHFCKSVTGSIQNAHFILKEQLESTLNKDKNLVQIMYVLHETLQPLTSLSQLSNSAQFGLFEKRAQIPISEFVLLPQCLSIVRVTYQSLYCLEFCLQGNGYVSVRDGAYSRFDHSTVVEGFTPIQGLSTFLSHYTDKNATCRRRSQSEDDNPPSPVAVDIGSENNGAVGGMGIGNFLSQHSTRGGPLSPAAQNRDPSRFHPPLTPPLGSNPNTPASPHTMTPNSNLQTQGSQQHQNYSNSPGMSLNLASPTAITPNASSVIPHPSPSSGLVASPLSQVHAPSPAGLMPTSSPGPSGSNILGQATASSGGSFLQQQQQPPPGSHINLDSSPFPSSQSMASPAASNWTGSPNISRPSPVRPGQSPVGCHISNMHSPQQTSCINPTGCATDLQRNGGSPYGPSARILPQRSWAGAIPTLVTYDALDLMCSAAKQSILPESLNLSPLDHFLGCAYMRRQLQRFIQSDEGLSAVDGAEPGVIHFKTDFFQCRVSLDTQHLQSLHARIQPNALESGKHWNSEELQLLERFFESRVVSPPYKPNNLLGFIHILSLPQNVLKDFVQLMRLELIPGLVQQQQFKWTVQLCLRVPPSAIPVVPCGMPAIVQHKVKILFYLKIMRASVHYCPGDDDAFPLVIPLIYDVRTNLTQLANERDAAPGSVMSIISVQLKRFAEYGVNPQECSIFPNVRNLLLNLCLPLEALGPQSQQQQLQQQQQQQQQHISSISNGTQQATQLQQQSQASYRSQQSVTPVNVIPGSQ